MLRWILALLLIPFLDAVLLGVVAASYTGWLLMVLLVVLTGLIGMLLVRAEGRRTIRKMQRSLAEGRPPTNELLDGAFLIAAGAFLLTPGLVTDVLGFLFVIPLSRVPIRSAVKRFVIIPYADKKTGGFASGKVWTVGFPNDADDASTTRTGSTDGSTYDLGEDAYSVDPNDEGSYTIDFGDETTRDTDVDDSSAR
jgi:UPF0716 protein FxsA